MTGNNNSSIQTDKILIILIVFLGLYSSAIGQVISEQTRDSVIGNLVDLVMEQYVDQDVGLVVVDSIKAQDYNQLNGPSFARRLTRDLRRFSQDKHFRVYFDQNENFSNSITVQNRSINYGFEKVEILNGNVGYCRISYFEDPSIAGGIVYACMQYLSNADSILLDLRDNDGGRKAMVQLLASFFFNESSKHIYDIIGRSEEFHGYTEVFLPVKKLDKIPLYILVNGESFSASEMFAFIMQIQGRAVILGSTTAGGGHTVQNIHMSNGFSVNLPVGKVVDPITKTGWEKTGIKPDIEINEFVNEIKFCHSIILKDKIKKEKDSEVLSKLMWQVDILDSELNPVQVSDSLLRKYAGTYGRRIVTYQNGRIYYQGRAGIEKSLMIPISDELFRFKEVDFFRVKFLRDESGNPVSLQGIYDDGFEDEFHRSNNSN